MSDILKIVASSFDKFKLKINVVKMKTMLINKMNSILNFNIKIKNTLL